MNRRKKHSRLEHFQRNAAGDYVYTGAYVSYASTEKSRKRLLLELWGLVAVGTACLLACGFLPVKSFNGCFYVLLPYIASLITAISCLWAVGVLTSGGDPLRQYVHDATVLKLPGRSIVSAVAALACMLGEGIYCIQNGAGDEVGNLIAFFLLCGVGAAAMVLLCRCIRGAKWQ